MHKLASTEDADFEEGATGLYDSDAYAVVCTCYRKEAQLPSGIILLQRCIGFEILDRAANTLAFLDGSLSEAFQFQIREWQHKTPTQDEVEIVLARYALTIPFPLGIH